MGCPECGSCSYYQSDPKEGSVELECTECGARWWPDNPERPVEIGRVST